MPKIRNTKNKLNILMDILVTNSDRTNKSIESISEQISSLTDLLVAERNFSAKQYRKESILKQRSLKLETTNKAFQDELDEINSNRREIQSKINSILEEERRIQKQERKAEQEKSTYYRRTAKSDFESGNLISGLFLSFLGRNEKTAEAVQEENKQADKEERDLRKKNLIDELTALKEERKQLRNDIKRAFSDGFKPLVNLTTSKSVIQENTQTQDMIYEMRDKTKEDNYNKQILDKITTIDVNVTKIEKSLLDLNKNINTTTSNSGIVDLLSSANQLKNLPRLLRPLTQILRPLMNVLSLPVLGGIAGAVASFSGFFSLLNKDQDLYNKRKDEEQKSKVESAKQQTTREDAIIRRDVDIEIQGIEARGTTITPDILESYAKAYEQKGEKKKALAYREKIKELKPKEQQILPPTAEEATYDAADYDMKLEKESEAVMVQSLTPSTATVAEKISEELPLYKVPVPTKLEQPTVQPTKTFVAKKQNVPTKSNILAPKVGVIKPNMEIGIIDRALGAIGSIIPTSFGSLGTPAMAATTIPPKYKPEQLSQKTNITDFKTISKLIGAAETGGSYDLSYGDVIGKNSKIVNKLKNKLMTAEEYSGGKKLSEMTIQEVIDFQKYRESKQSGTGAVGKYQFIPRTLLDRLQATGISKTSLFNEQTQDILNESLQKANLQTLKRKAQRLGLGDIEISPGLQYMAHYIGAGGAGAVMEAAQKGQTNLSIEQALVQAGFKNPVIEDKTGNIINEELRNKMTVGNFEQILQERLNTKASTIVPNQNNSGLQTYSSSIANKELNSPMNNGAIIVAPQTNIVTNNTQTANKNVREKPKEPNNNAFSYIVNALTWS